MRFLYLLPLILLAGLVARSMIVGDETSSIEEEIVPEATEIPVQSAVVVDVIDGDTIEVELDGKRETVRYLGVDAPDTDHPFCGPEIFAPGALARNRGLVEGQTVRLEGDVTNADALGRLLRYVYVDDVMVNVELLSGGFATATSTPPNGKHDELFEVMEEIAQDDDEGMWAVAKLDEGPERCIVPK